MILRTLNDRVLHFLDTPHRHAIDERDPIPDAKGLGSPGPQAVVAVNDTLFGNALNLEYGVMGVAGVETQALLQQGAPQGRRIVKILQLHS